MPSLLYCCSVVAPVAIAAEAVALVAGGDGADDGLAGRQHPMRPPPVLSKDRKPLLVLLLLLLTGEFPFPSVPGGKRVGGGRCRYQRKVAAIVVAGHPYR